MSQRISMIAELAGLDPDELDAVSLEHGLGIDQADRMIENAIGVLGIPLGLCSNLRVNGEDRIVPMATEEPSVIAAASTAAKRIRAGGGVRTTVHPPIMDGQIQILDLPDAARARAMILAERDRLLEVANRDHPRLLSKGGGAIDIQVQELDPCDEDDPFPLMMIARLSVNVADAMGANVVNSMCEALAPELEEITGGRVRLRILSNLCDRRLVTAEVNVPLTALDGSPEFSGEHVAHGIVEASVFAERDPHRAATHNKGIMNGVDAVLLAFGQDMRAVEAGAHAFAARKGRYAPLSKWRVKSGELVGTLTLPMAVGTVGGIAEAHPTVGLVYRIAGVTESRDLASLAASVGIAQNLGALRALAAEGIQRGHMRLHARKQAPASLDEDESDPDVAFCRAVLPRVSRTFALSIEALPPALREPVRVAYLLCRLVDTVEDEPGLSDERRQLLFAQFDAGLQGRGEHPLDFERDIHALTDDGADGELCRNASAVFRRFRQLEASKRTAIRTRLLEMSRGMRIYTLRAGAGEKRAIRDHEDLERYCYFVAGTVGKLLTDLFEKYLCPMPSETLRYLRERAVSFGIGLQLVNILKDVAGDHQRGVCFLPAAAAEKHGVPLERLLEPELREPALALVRETAAIARAHLTRASEYTMHWPLPAGAPIRLFCLVPLQLALGTLDLIEEGEDMLRPGREPKVSHEFVAEVLTRAREVIKDDESLATCLGLDVDAEEAAS